jgi:hypothetical protein
VKDKHYNSVDDIIAENKGKSIEEIAAEEAAEGGPWLISADELRAAGAFDVPAAWRKSLGGQRGLFSDLNEENHLTVDNHQPTPMDLDRDESANELS